eukprot:CAMPEP_0178372504 /NCGR_PEP_ID=MMETSP0689_2-20121128/1384_1 /TAXON_ID=160604 /ORGANISM="Amphidinium massartii, Strain CS-259" /LENGTH=790 /DNA_ID=CAMNT_0019992423 /DNA_START=6 /DNA_END=2379 /DNA_ORIENTATION=-
MQLADAGEEELAEVIRLLDQIICSGYAETGQAAVAAGAWKPIQRHLLKEFSQEEIEWRKRVREAQGSAIKDPFAEIIVRMYVHLAEHIVYYENFSGMQPEFWDPKLFERVLALLPDAMAKAPETPQADIWEECCEDLVAALSCCRFFLEHWDKSTDSTVVNFDIRAMMPLLQRAVDLLGEYDKRFGNDISAKSRAEPLEELVRLTDRFGLHLSRYVDTMDAEAQNEPKKTRRLERGKKQAASLIVLLLHVLELGIPTCAPEPDDDAENEDDEHCTSRQLHPAWVEQLWDLCCTLGKPRKEIFECLPQLFRFMVTLPLEEQKYRLRAIALITCNYIKTFGDQLGSKELPAELADVRVVLNAVLKDGGCENVFFLDALSQFPSLLEFESKREILQALFEQMEMSSTKSPLRLIVPTDNVLDGVCSALSLEEPDTRIDVPVEIEFRTGFANNNGIEIVDEGEDTGGLRRQWLDRATRYFLSSDLFRCYDRYAQPSPEAICALVQEDWKEQFQLFGCILGIALINYETLPIRFAPNFLMSVFKHKTLQVDSMALLQSLDKVLHTKLKYIASGDYTQLSDSLHDALEQANLPTVFSIQESLLPEYAAFPLKPGGAEIAVTEENKMEFITLIVQRLLFSGLDSQVAAFRQGLQRVVPEELLERIVEMLEIHEVELMISGADELDVADWEENTHYENGYSKESTPVVWFWEVVKEMSHPLRARLLAFATGSSQVPSGGFRYLQPEYFTIQRVAVSDRYPEAHTCANVLDLPEYTSKEILAQKLHFAIEEAGDAFGRR